MSSLATVRTAVRKDLHDEDATAYRWTDAVLDRHINRALLEYSQKNPRERKTTVLTTAGSRDISLAAVTDRIRVLAIEYPTGQYPPAFAPFTLWGDTLTLDLVTPPSAIENASLFWEAYHTINGTTTFPIAHDDVIACGAAGYAALDWASFATNRVNTGGPDVWGRYMDFANVRLEQFRQMLRDLPAASRVRQSRLYTPAEARFRSQTTDPGPV